MRTEVPGLSESKESFIAENVPGEIVAKINPYLADTEKLFSWGEDFPHRKAHTIELLSSLDHARWNFTEDEVGPIGFYLASRTLQLHDKGYVFVKNSLIKPEEHHFASILIAGKIEPDVRVLYGILHHVDDTLPQNAPLWVRLARDIDRACGIGYTGLIRQAFYFGFEHPGLTESGEEDLIDKRVLCEDNYPDGFEEYEDEAKKFFDDFVLPFLLKDDNLALHFRVIIDKLNNRFMGDTRYGIEPVMRDIRKFFEVKLRHSVLASESIGAEKPLAKMLASLDIMPYL